MSKKKAKKIKTSMPAKPKRYKLAKGVKLDRAIASVFIGARIVFGAEPTGDIIVHATGNMRCSLLYNVTAEWNDGLTGTRLVESAPVYHLDMLGSDERVGVDHVVAKCFENLAAAVRTNSKELVQYVRHLGKVPLRVR